MIRCEGVSFSYGADAPVLNDLDLDMGPGLTLLLGPNGCGKTTLIRLAAGVEMPDEGRIFIGGLDLWKEEIAARSRLAYYPEYPDLTPYATIGEILDLVCRLRREPREAGVDALRETGLSHLKDRTVREVSNGQRRRALFAACLIGRPEVVIFDEPLEGMDQGMRRRILSWLKERRDDGSAILLAGHEIRPFLPFADRAVVLKEGRAQCLANLPREEDDEGGRG